jgi:protein-S-isoprenylcysteine O-methyltransferase Ste14
VKGIIRELLRPFIVLAILLIAAGTFTWTNAWVFFVIFLIFQLAYVGILGKTNPQLLTMRSKIQKGTKRFDKVLLAFYFSTALVLMIIAGLDVRYAWSTMASGFIFLGIVLYIVAYGLVLWAMIVNPHFEGTVRIQEERHHTVCSSGPYKFVRHPGYVGMILGGYSISFILGSWWGLVPACLMTVLAVIRTRLEDQTLHQELPGYKEYSQRTRYRLVPFVW